GQRGASSPSSCRWTFSLFARRPETGGGSPGLLSGGALLLHLDRATQQRIGDGFARGVLDHLDDLAREELLFLQDAMCGRAPVGELAVPMARVAVEDLERARIEDHDL